MKFNKNEFGWKEKVNTNELATKKYVDDNLPHYNETLKFEISGDDYKSFMNNNYFNMNALDIDETKLYVGKAMSYDEKYNYKFIYNKETDTLISEDSFICIYNHKSYDGENFIEDENSAVLKFDTVPMGTGGFEGEGYFRLYEVDKVKLDSNCLSDDVIIKNSLTVGSRMGDIGIYSVAEGDSSIASDYASHAEGYYTTASGYASHAEGSNTEASGEMSHAEGDSSIASDYASHAEGGLTIASGYYAHTEGYNTTASSYASHAEGNRTIASSENQHVQGKNNIEDTENKYAHIVGNGEADTARSNAHTLDWEGNGWYKGELYTGGTSQSDANKVLTTANISFNESGELVVTINGVSKTFVPKA